MARRASIFVFGALVVGVAAGSAPATFSGKNGRISYSAVSGSHVEIFSANPDGSDIEKLTASTPRHAASVVSHWSPDGSVIAFDSDRTDIDGRKRKVQIYLMTADGENETQLTRGPGFHGDPGWSPDGSRLAIDSDWGKPSLSGIWIIPASDPDGVTVADAIRVTDTPKRDGFDAEAQFSPDGSTIVFSRFLSRRRTAIFRVNLDGSGLDRLTPYGLNASHPNISPDGSRITFDSGDAGAPGSKGDIYVMRADGSRKRALTDRPPVSEGEPFDLAQNPVYSPNGRRIMYTQFREAGSDLVKMRVDGSRKHTILGGGKFPNKVDWGTHP